MNMQIVRFTGYMLLTPDKNEDNVLEALERATRRIDGILRYPTIDSRDTDWEYGDDNHPLNNLDVPVTLLESYLD